MSRNVGTDMTTVISLQTCRKLAGCAPLSLVLPSLVYAGSWAKAQLSRPMTMLTTATDRNTNRHPSQPSTVCAPAAMANAYLQPQLSFVYALLRGGTVACLHQSSCICMVSYALCCREASCQSFSVLLEHLLFAGSEDDHSNSIA